MASSSTRNPLTAGSQNPSTDGSTEMTNAAPPPSATPEDAKGVQESSAVNQAVITELKKIIKIMLIKTLIRTGSNRPKPIDEINTFLEAVQAYQDAIQKLTDIEKHATSGFLKIAVGLEKRVHSFHKKIKFLPPETDIEVSRNGEVPLLQVCRQLKENFSRLVTIHDYQLELESMRSAMSDARKSFSYRLHNAPKIALTVVNDIAFAYSELQAGPEESSAFKMLKLHFERLESLYNRINQGLSDKGLLESSLFSKHQSYPETYQAIANDIVQYDKSEMEKYGNRIDMSRFITPIRQAIVLFDVYADKILAIHHHRKIARAIVEELNRILASQKSEPEKIEEASQYIENQKNLLHTQDVLKLDIKDKPSEFLWVTRFVLEKILKAASVSANPNPHPIFSRTGAL